MSRTHRFTLGLGVGSVGLLAFLWTRTDLSHDEAVVLLASVVPLIYLQFRGIEVRALPSSANEPHVTVTWSLTEAVSVPLALVVAPAAAATLLMASSVFASAVAVRRASHARPASWGLILGSAGLSALDLLLVSLVGRWVLRHEAGTGGKVVAVAVGVIGMVLLGIAAAWGLSLLTRRWRGLDLEFELLRLSPLVAVPGAFLILAYRPEDLSGLAAAAVLSALLCETVRRFGERGLELRRRDAEREELLRAMLRAAAADRKSLAARLHDGPVQRLLASRLRLETLARADVGPTAAGVREVASTLGEVVEELRTFIAGSVPTPELMHNLAEALRQDCEAVRPSFSFGVHLTTRLDRKVSEHTELAAFQIAHEALLNAERHSAATSVDVTAETTSLSVILEVRDNGVGVSQQRVEIAKTEGHFGIVTMQERARAVGGRLDLTSSEGKGTAIVATLPRYPPTRPRARSWRGGRTPPATDLSAPEMHQTC